MFCGLNPKLYFFQLFPVFIDYRFTSNKSGGSFLGPDIRGVLFFLFLIFVSPILSKIQFKFYYYALLGKLGQKKYMGWTVLLKDNQLLIWETFPLIEWPVVILWYPKIGNFRQNHKEAGGFWWTPVKWRRPLGAAILEYNKKKLFLWAELNSKSNCKNCQLRVSGMFINK